MHHVERVVSGNLHKNPRWPTEYQYKKENLENSMYTARFYLKYLQVRCRKISDDFFLLKILARDTLDNYHQGSRHTVLVLENGYCTVMR